MYFSDLSNERTGFYDKAGFAIVMKQIGVFEYAHFALVGGWLRERGGVRVVLDEVELDFGLTEIG